jgi:hypothetical protein
MPAMDDQSTHLVPIGYFVSSPIFLTEKESWSPSIYSWTPNHWLPLFFLSKTTKKKEPNAHLGTATPTRQQMYQNHDAGLCLSSLRTKCFDTNGS